MGIIPRVAPHRQRHPNGPLAVLLAVLLIGPVTACAAVRPVVKIGLIAPFEGLYRDSGYAALRGLRRALVECAAPGVDVLPLALDDSADPELARRAAQKLLVDPAVVAVIGPLPFASISPVREIMASTAVPWFVPAIITPEDGFTQVTSSAWLLAMAGAVIEAQAPARLLVAGLPPELVADFPSALGQVAVERVSGPAALSAAVRPGDAVLWFAAPHAGADWHTAHPDVPIWLSTPYGADIWIRRDRLPVELNRSSLAAHWLIWTDRGYNSWAQQPSDPTDPSAYLTYRAACMFLARPATGPSLRDDSWQLSARELLPAP